jgi:hypothetical protein
VLTDSGVTASAGDTADPGRRVPARRQLRPGHRLAAVSSDSRPDRHALLELDALLDQITLLRDEGDAAAARFDKDDRYRWVLHRLWIAGGNEALAYTAATGQAVRSDRTWANLYDLRNHLAHSRLPGSPSGRDTAWPCCCASTPNAFMAWRTRS